MDPTGWNFEVSEVKPNYSYMFDFEVHFTHQKTRIWMQENWTYVFWWVARVPSLLTGCNIRPVIRYSGVYMLVIFGGQQFMANRPRWVSNVDKSVEGRKSIFASHIRNHAQTTRLTLRNVSASVFFFSFFFSTSKKCSHDSKKRRKSLAGDDRYEWIAWWKVDTHVLDRSADRLSSVNELLNIRETCLSRFFIPFKTADVAQVMRTDPPNLIHIGEPLKRFSVFLFLIATITKVLCSVLVCAFDEWIRFVNLLSVWSPAAVRGWVEIWEFFNAVRLLAWEIPDVAWEAQK